MSAIHALRLPASPTGFGLPGSWTLARDRAITLDARRAGFLRVSHGSIWATLDGPHHGPANDWGDVVLRCGARIHLTPGQHVVLESFPLAANAEAGFSWEPDQDDATVAAPSAWRHRMQILAGWALAAWRGLRRVPAVFDRWAPFAPDAFADTRVQALRQLGYWTRNQP